MGRPAPGCYAKRNAEPALTARQGVPKGASVGEWIDRARLWLDSSETDVRPFGFLVLDPVVGSSRWRSLQGNGFDQRNPKGLAVMR